MARLIGRFGAVAMTLALAALAGCAAPPPDDAWVLAPIRYDNRLDGAEHARLTDVTFPMRLASDTAGGLWGTSAGSWLHLDADGQTVRRFNLEEWAARVDAIAAVSPTQLVVTASAGELTDTARAVMLFDTDAMSWHVLQAETSLLGDIAARGDDVYYLRYTDGAPSFVVMHVTFGGDAEATAVSPELPRPIDAIDASGAALDVGADGTIYVATATERFVVSAAGEVLERVAAPSESPDVAVSPAGEVLWSSALHRETRHSVALVDASAEAREAIEPLLGCRGDGFVLAEHVLPLCGVRGLAWLDADTLVMSVGGESGAPLLRVTPPRSVTTGPAETAVPTQKPTREGSILPSR